MYSFNYKPFLIAIFIIMGLGAVWFALDTFIFSDEPKIIDVPTIMGTIVKDKSPGLLKFTIDGNEYRLEPVSRGKRLFIILFCVDYYVDIPRCQRI